MCSLPPTAANEARPASETRRVLFATLTPRPPPPAPAPPSPTAVSPTNPSRSRRRWLAARTRPPPTRAREARPDREVRLKLLTRRAAPPTCVTAERGAIVGSAVDTRNREPVTAPTPASDGAAATCRPPSSCTPSPPTDFRDGRASSALTRAPSATSKKRPPTDSSFDRPRSLNTAPTSGESVVRPNPPTETTSEARSTAHSLPKMRPSQSSSGIGSGKPSKPREHCALAREPDVPVTRTVRNWPSTPQEPSGLTL